MLSQLIILAGGMGTRLAPVAKGVPKVLVKVGGKPVLQHQLELAAACGFTDVRIFAGPQADQIQALVDKASPVVMRVQVEIESEPLGNAGALLQKLDSLEDDFLVLYGDVMISADLRRFAEAHVASGADFSLFVHPNDHPHDSDLVEVDSHGWVTALHPNPHPPDRFFGNLVNAALYAVQREAVRPFAREARKRDFTKHIIPSLLARGGKIRAYRSTEYLKDMGTPERLERVERDWDSGRIRLRTARDLDPAVFLDRDGTLNVDRGYLRSPDQLDLLPGVGEALRTLRHAGFRLVVLTNQPVIARGELTEQDLCAIHGKLEWELGKAGAFLDAIYCCPHHPDKGFSGERPELKGPCDCRKPATGLLKKACDDLLIDPARSWMIGDTTVDLEMAARAGLRSILVETGCAGRDGKYPVTPQHIAPNLHSAAGVILKADREGSSEL